MFIWLHIALMAALFLGATLSVRRGGVVVWRGNPLAMVPALYLLSAVSSLFVPEASLKGFDFGAYQWYHYAAYSFFLFLCLAPIGLLKGVQLDPRQIVGGRGLKVFYFMASPAIWFAFIYQVPYAVSAFRAGAWEVRNGLTVLGEGVLPGGWLTTFSVVVSSFYVVFILMFYVAVVRGMNRFYVVSTFVGGGLYVVSSICFTARDGALFYVLTMLFGYQLVHRQLPEAVKHRMALVMAVALALLVGVLGLFTVQRFFADGNVSDLLAGTLGYIGQQPYVFAETIVSQLDFYGFDLRWPLIPMLLTGSEPEVIRTQPFEWSFGTFLKDYYAMFGWSSLVTLAVGQAALFGLLFLWCRRRSFLPFVLVVAFYFQLMISGVFYFRLGTRGGNLYMLLYGGLVLMAMLAGRRRLISPRGQVSGGGVDHA